jgi:hypothetical protein
MGHMERETEEKFMQGFGGVISIKGTAWKT